MRATLCFAALAGLVLLGTPAFAGCPFAGFIMSGGSDEPPPAWHQGLGRKLQQAKCNVAALAAQPAAPAPIIPQGEVDALVKQVALEVFLNGVPGFVPGLYPGGKLATKLPLGGLLRVPFHDAGTFQRAKGTGGANGSFRFENGKPPNTGANLKSSLDLCTKWRAAINARLAADRRVPRGVQISFADTFQLVGAVVSIITNGPGRQLIWDPLPVGRLDSPGPDNAALLPGKGDDFATLACLFLQNGYSIEDLVALSGSHSIGFHAGGKTPMTKNPLAFNGEYFQLVLGGKAAFKSDNVLAAPGALPQSRQLVQLYAGNLPAFHAAFARSYIKMASMGARWRSYGAKLLA